MPVTTNNNYPVEFDFKKEQSVISNLISSWEGDETEKVKTRREVRENKRNVEDEQQKGTILKDETIIPDRTINTNIHRGRVPYISYITQTKRFLILNDVREPKLYVEPHELWFTRGMRYPDWSTTWFKLVDGMMTHGGCAIEVVYDENKPFNCAIEYIPRDSLIFNQKTKNIQASPRLLRKYEVSLLELDEMAKKYNFNPASVEKIKNNRKHQTTEEYVCIYKMLFKRQGVVWNAWYSQDAVEDWLRPPVLHDIGLFDFDPSAIIMAVQAGAWASSDIRLQFAQPKPLKSYPIIWFQFDVQENEILLEIQGRAALDIQEQEALTAMISNAVNGSTRASRFYPTAEGEPGSDAKLEELGPLKHGTVLKGKISTFQPAWPNNFLLSVVQVIDQRKANQTGNTDFAAIARKDANKTATEMNLAVSQSQELNTTELIIFASPFLMTYALCFEIATHQAIFLLTKDEPEDFEMLFRTFNLSPAGDVEVVKRLEERERAKEFFNIVRGTPLAEKLFAFLIQQYFPDQASDWIKVLNSPDLKVIIQQLLSILIHVPTDELSPEQRAAFQSVIISAQNVVGNGDNSKVSPNSQQQTAGTVIPGNAPGVPAPGAA